MKKSQLTYHSLLQRIHQVRKREKLFFLITGIFHFLSINLILMLFALVITMVFRPSSSNRILIDFLLIFTSAFLFIFLILRPIYALILRAQSPSDKNIADRIGNKFTFIKDRLANALQVFNFYNRNEEGYSLELVGATLTEVNNQCIDKNFLEIVDKKRLVQAAKLAIAFAIISVGFWGIFSSAFNTAFLHLVHPAMAFQQLEKFTLKITPGDIEVVKNETVNITVYGEGELPQQVTLHLKNKSNGNEHEKKLSLTYENLYQHKIENIKDSTEYYITANTLNSPRYLISVIELPIVRHLQLKVTSPAYSRIETKFLDENIGDVTALKGSVVDVNVLSNKNLDEAKLIFDKNKPKDLNVQGRKATGKFYVFSNDEYKILLTDLSQRTNSDPIEYRIHILEDSYPAVKISQPGRDIDISEDMLVTLGIEGEDDFGFSLVQLAYIVHRSSIETDASFTLQLLKLNNYAVEKFSVNYNWNLSDLNLFPEDVVTYYVEVFDNDNIAGPKSAKSLMYRIHFPSIYEIYTEVQQEHEMTFETFEGMYEQSKELKEKLSELAQEMKKEPNVNWEGKKQLEDVIQNQQQMQQALEEIEQKLDQMIQRMEKNDLISLETLEKYQEFQQLLQEMMSEELKEAIKELQKAMESIDPEELKNAVEKLEINQEDFLRSLERNLAILKRLQIEQRLDEVAKKVEQLLKEQKELLDKAAEKSTDEMNNMAKEQQDIQQKTEELKKEIEALKEDMSQFADMPTDRIDAALEMMDREQLSDNMKMASKMYQSGNKSGAQKKGEQAQHTLSELTDMLKSAKQELTQQQKQEVLNEFKNISRDLISISKSQEDVLKSATGLDQNSPQFNKIADSQQNLLSGLERVADKIGQLSQKTFFVTPEIVRAIGLSLSNMQQSLTNIEERNSSRANRKQSEAMHSLNEAVIQIRQSMNNLNASGSASGLQEMMDRLSQMSGKQQGINQQTMQLGLGQQPMSLQQQAAMARLAAEQAALKKSLEQLQQEFGNRSEILGRLDKIAEEMDDVVKDLQSKNVNRRTIDRQQKILSRLLDAQKSIQQRDYSKKRKAETGKMYLTKSPSQLPADLGERDFQLRQDLLKAMKQGYTRDYQELIRKYFEALVNENENN